MTAVLVRVIGGGFLLTLGAGLAAGFPGMLCVVGFLMLLAALAQHVTNVVKNPEGYDARQD